MNHARLWWGAVVVALAAAARVQAQCPHDVIIENYEQHVCPASSGAGVEYVVSAQGGEPLSYRWRWNLGLGDWVDIVEGANADPATGQYLFAAEGSQATRLRLSDWSDSLAHIVLHCWVSNSCGTADAGGSLFVSEFPWNPPVGDLPICATRPTAGGLGVGFFSPAARTVEWQWEPGGDGVWLDLVDGWNDYQAIPAIHVTIFADYGEGLRVLEYPLGRSGVGVRAIVTQGVCGPIASDPPAILRFNSADFDGDGDIGTDGDIEAFFACLSGVCCDTCGSIDFNADGDQGTDADIESFFRVLAGGSC